MKSITVSVICYGALLVGTTHSGEADPFSDPASNEQSQSVDPAEAALVAMLQKLGPRAKGMGVRVNDDGIPTVSVNRYENPDLSALRGAPVRSMEIMGSMDELASGKILDLAPLAGMPLETLWVYKVPVKDIAPLKGSNLKRLSVIACPVSDLSPLSKLPLESLNLWLAGVSDLEPLKGKRLKHLNIDVSEPARISDLTPLDGMGLESLTFREDDVTKGMDVIRNMKSLKEINGKPPSDFWQSYEKGRPTRELVHQSGLKFARLGVDEDGTCGLYFDGDQIMDLTPLKSIPVTALFISNSKVVDLRPLAGTRLESFCIGSSQLSDLSPLRGVPLTTLSVSSDQVSDLSPLRELKPRSLYLKCPKVTDLSALRGMPLDTLGIEGCGVGDLSVLEGMSLEFIHFDPERVRKGMEVLRGMKTLKQINRQDAEEFLKADSKRGGSGDPFAE